MSKRKITDLTLEEINEEIDRMTNVRLDGSGYGTPEAWEAHDRKLQVLIRLREQKLAQNQPQSAEISNSTDPISYSTVASSLRSHLSEITNSDTSALDTSFIDMWPQIESLLFELDSDAVQDIISRAGLALDWQLSKAEAFSHKTRKRAYRGRLSKAVTDLSEERKQKFVENVVRELLSRDGKSNDRIRNILGSDKTMSSKTIPDAEASGISIKGSNHIAEPEPMEKVFIIHGHDEELKKEVQLLISQVRLDYVVLHEKSDRGRTIIDKLIEEGKDAAYVVALLSPDDELRDGTRRARQNVVLEIGYFLGKLGKGKVRLLKKGDVEIPSDLQGILYTVYGSDGVWKMKLLKEIKDAGIDIDLDKAFEKF